MKVVYREDQFGIQAGRHEGMPADGSDPRVGTMTRYELVGIDGTTVWIPAPMMIAMCRAILSEEAQHG